MKAFDNHFLLSHLYLDELIQSEKEAEEAKRLVSSLRGWRGGWDDSSLESILSTMVEPTLVSLDFNYQYSVENDQIFELKSPSVQEKQLGLCYVVSIDKGESLDSTMKGRHYAAELIRALQEENLKWGIMTDGRRWRMYNAEELAPYETYLEVDLEAVIEEGESSQDAGILFHKLFRKEALLKDDDGECELDHHQQRSEETTERIEEHLSECIEEVMRDLCQGFVEQDDRQQYTESQRDKIFSDATILLYRMLFMLYAEARGLLPVGDPAYDPVSLSYLVDQAIDYTKESGLEDPEGTTLWKGLGDLSAWINSGDEAHHIPCYNGDLFDDEDKTYIHDFTIPDKYLAPALFSLGTIEANNEKGYQRIDYRDLAVRHLGSIYEGLLEYKLFIAQQKRVRRPDGKGGFSFPELAETTLKKGEEDQIIGVDEVYFAHNAGERKAMGAYYTPEYIVDYIVENTARRGLEKRRENMEEKLPQWISGVEASPPGERSRLQKTVDQRLVDFVESEVLTFSVCDPAMGSGHFLVNAAHQITNFIVETLNLTDWENERINSDPVYWRRRVVKSCIYGVDLNELAVELAKLSLWLTAIEEGKPLGFLDHHLRLGNSLIGAKLDDLTDLLYKPTAKEKRSKEAGQMTFYDAAPEFSRMFTELQEKLDRISSMVAENPEEVKAQEAAYQEIREELKPLRDMGDAIVARHFGVGIDDATIKKVLHDDNDPIFDRVARVSEEHHLFHWELEFFDEFISGDQDQNSRKNGFDVIIGNPPFGSDISSGEQNFVDFKYKKVRSYSKNSAMYFAELTLEKIQIGGFVGMLSPKSICYSVGWKPCAQLISTHLEKLIDVTKAFKGVLLEQIFYILEKTFGKSDYYLAGQMNNSGELGLTNIPLSFFETTNTLLVGVNSDEYNIYNNISKNSIEISDISETRRGLNWQP